MTYGWILSGFARAVTGMGMRDLIREEVARPLNTDGLHLGRPPAEAPTKAAQILPPQGTRANPVFNLVAPRVAGLPLSCAGRNRLRRQPLRHGHAADAGQAAAASARTAATGGSAGNGTATAAGAAATGGSAGDAAAAATGAAAAGGSAGDAAAAATGAAAAGGSAGDAAAATVGAAATGGPTRAARGGRNGRRHGRRGAGARGRG
ncbi:CubicO group peptidase (beta-lactamase class C family) [Mycobacterium sp. URHB0021]